MRIGIAKEIKAQEGRVALLPHHVKTLTDRHDIFIHSGAGKLAGISDEDYCEAGAQLVTDSAELFKKAQLIVKVKELEPQEFNYLHDNHIIFTNLHSAANPEQLDALLKARLTSIAAEETHELGSPNCPLAGEIGALEGLRLSLMPHGGSGKHFLAHYNAPPAQAMVIGLGSVGRGVLRTLLPLGVKVTGLDEHAGTRFKTKLDWANAHFEVFDMQVLESLLPHMDMIFNCVLWDKSRTDHLISRKMLKTLNPKTIIVDISCDTAGAIETCRASSWDDPVYQVDGIRHFCVDNIPGATPVTASAGYGDAILPKITKIADLGIIAALKQDPWLRKGLTTIDGILTLREAAILQNKPFTAAEKALKL